MSRNFISDQDLIDQLQVSNTQAFEELYQRYWFSLFSYCLNKTADVNEARRLVSQLFTELWNIRQQLSLDFSIHTWFYTAVRKAVIESVTASIAQSEDLVFIEDDLIPSFNAHALQTARRPVQFYHSAHETPVPKARFASLRLPDAASSFLKLRYLGKALQTMMNF